LSFREKNSSAPNLAPVPREPFIGKVAKDQNPQEQASTGNDAAAIQTLSSATLRKAGSGGAAIEAERRFAEETNLARQDCLGPSWAPGMFFVLAEVLV
jgi:hypothetical protein